jgi:hypothetical protein
MLATCSEGKNVTVLEHGTVPTLISSGMISSLSGWLIQHCKQMKTHHGLLTNPWLRAVLETFREEIRELEESGV